MIKFTDLCKAFVRFWFVILICIIIVLTAVIAFTPKQDSYTAVSTITIRNDNDTIPTSTTANTLIPTIIKQVSNTSFYITIKQKVNEENKELGKILDSPTKVSNNLEIQHIKNNIYFTINYTLNNKEHAKLVAEIISDTIIEDFNTTTTTMELDYLNKIDIVKNHNKLLIYLVIGVMIGLVLGVVLITFFVVFNPYVENKDLLSKETETNILSNITKKDRNKKIENFATNLKLMLNESNNKYIAFTTDNNKYDINNIVNNLAEIFKNNKKVAILSYEDVIDKKQGIDYLLLDTENTNKETIDKQTAEYDIVLGICPNMITYKHYLHMANIFTDLIIVAKRWKSKTNDIITIKNNAKNKDINLLGIIYEA